MAAVSDRMESHYRPDDLMLLYLPLAHNFGRLMSLSGAYVGFTIAFLPDPLRVADALLQVRPTLLAERAAGLRRCAPGRSAGLDAEGDGAEAQRCWKRSCPMGGEVGLEGEGRAIPSSLRVQHRIADRLVYAKVRDASEVGFVSRSPAARRSPRSWRSSSTRSASSSSRATA